MKHKEPVSNIMTKNVYTITLNRNLFDVRDFFYEKKIRHVPVVNGNRLLGILSLTDIQRISFGNVFADYEGADTAVFEMLTVEQVMKHHPKTVSSTDTIQEAALILAQEEFHALPVVDDSNLVGIVTTTDVINYLLD